MRIKTQASIPVLFFADNHESNPLHKIKSDLCRVAAKEIFKNVELVDKGAESKMFPDEPEKKRFEICFTAISEVQLTIIAACVSKIRKLANNAEVSDLLDEIKKQLLTE
ncbi:MAG: hypothetical protein V4651_09930 [Bacteroidota bacterium]